MPCSARNDSKIQLARDHGAAPSRDQAETGSEPARKLTSHAFSGIIPHMQKHFETSSLNGCPRTIRKINL